MRSVTGVDCEPNWAPERFAPREKGLFECFSAVTWQSRLVSLEFRNREQRSRRVDLCKQRPFGDHRPRASLAQLDRASVYGTEGYWFESSGVYLL